MESSSNITLRRKYDTNDNSYNSLPFLHESPLSSNNSCIKSLPDLSTLNDSEVAQLKDTINELRSQLDSAHNEVQNLLTENHSLQKIIKDQQNKINQLTTICTSNKKQTRKINRSNNVAKKIDFSEKTVSLTPLKNCPPTSKSVETSDFCCSSKENINIPTTNNASSKSSDILPSTNQTKSENDSVTNQQRNTDSVTKRRLLIFGAQRCSKLASRLTKLRYNTKYEHYDIYGCIKPFATTEEILRNFETLTLKPDDKIILSIGENDFNPTKLFIELSAVLTKLRSHCVIVLNVNYNNHLNIRLLNNKIKLICNNFSNCYYVDTFKKYENNIYNYNINYSLSQKLNFFIDCIDYKTTYLHGNKTGVSRILSERNYQKSCYSNTVSCPDLKNTPTLKQKTILDYFSKVLPENVSNPNFTQPLFRSQ